MILESVKNGIIALKINKTRTGLTVLGIVIGIASVIVVYSAGAGINSLIVGQIESFGGSDIVQTEVKIPSAKKGSGQETQSATNMAMGVQVTTLSLDDMDDINKLALIEDSYAGVIGQKQVSYGNEIYKAMLLGVTASYIKLDKSEVEVGRFFTESEDKSLSQVVVLGQKVKDKLFGDSDPIGKSIKLNKKKFKVIGVLKERGAVMVFDFDDIVYMPIRTLQKKVMGINNVQYMMHKVNDTTRIEEVEDEMRYLLRENHDIAQPDEKQIGVFDTGKDDFRVTSMIESIEIMDTVTGAITLLLLAIVIISLIVGGVGIMNIMYVAVTERTSEIGLRKAVGATYANIMIQFLVESVLVTVLGGIIGVIIGVILSWLIAFGAGYSGLDWKFSIPVQAYFVALGFSTFFGLVFGLYPARKAARMDPIEALRNE